MATVISNASPLIGLSRIDLVHILKELWGSLIIPAAVYKEVVIQGTGKPGTDIISKACNDWIDVREVKNRQEVEALQAVLDSGEAEVITLGQELKSDILLIDNREPRLFAKSVNLRVMGTVGIIRYAWHRGLIESPIDVFYRLRLNGFWLDNRLIEILKKE